MAPESASSLYDEYSKAHDHFVEQAQVLERLLQELVRPGALGKSIIAARAKDPLELYKKQLRKKYEDPWRDCPDIVGARIVVGTPIEKSDVLRILSTSSRIKADVEDQSKDATPHEIRYRGLHVHVTSEELKDSRGEPLRCEVQVRTMAEHAWAETEHRYVYKKGEVPDQLRRHFNRLLVLMELFDKEIEEGVTMAKELPGFRRLELSHALEHSISDITKSPNDHVLTMEAIEQLEGIGFGNSTELLSLVTSYLSTHADELTSVMEEHGPQAPGHDVNRDWIFSQGESILFLALLEEDEYRLSNALQGSDLYTLAEPLAIASGHTGYLRE